MSLSEASVAGSKSSVHAPAMWNDTGHSSFSPAPDSVNGRLLTCRRSYTLKSEKADFVVSRENNSLSCVSGDCCCDEQRSVSSIRRTALRLRLDVMVHSDEQEKRWRPGLSMTSLVRWNIRKVLEHYPDIDLQHVLESGQATLDVEPTTGRYCLPHATATAPSLDRHVWCALLAWQSKGQTDLRKLLLLADEIKAEIERESCHGGAPFFGGTLQAFQCQKSWPPQNAQRAPPPEAPPLVPERNTNPCPSGVRGLAVSASHRHFYDTIAGPLLRLPADSCLCGEPGDPVLPLYLEERKYSQPRELKIPKVLGGNCMERLKALDKKLSALRQRAERLCRRDTERIKLVKRAEVAWAEMESGFQKQLQQLEDKEDEILQRMNQAAMARNEFKCQSTGATELEAQVRSHHEAARAHLAGIVAATHVLSGEREQLTATVTELERRRNDQIILTEKLNHELLEQEEGIKCRMSLLSEELEAQVTQTRNALFTLQADVAALRDQFNAMADQLISAEDEKKIAIERMKQLKQNRASMISALEKCKETCETRCLSIQKKRIARKRELERMKDYVVECSCNVPKEKCCQVKRTPSLAAICKCSPDQPGKDCTCTTLKFRMMTALLRDLFTGLEEEIVEGNNLMSCRLLKCLADDIHLEKCPALKDMLSDYFSEFVANELDVAMVTAIEYCHATWVGSSCKDAAAMKSCHSLKRAGGPRDADGSHEASCSAARAWRRTQADVYHLAVNMLHLKRESIRRKDLVSMERNLAMIVQNSAITKSACSRTEIPTKDVQGYTWVDSIGSQQINDSHCTVPAVTEQCNDKESMLKKKISPVFKLRSSKPVTQFKNPESKNSHSNFIQRDDKCTRTLISNILDRSHINESPDTFSSRSCCTLLKSLLQDEEVNSRQNIFYIHRVDAIVDRTKNKNSVGNNENIREECNCESSCRCLNRRPPNIDVDDLLKEMMESRRSSVQQNNANAPGYSGSASKRGGTGYEQKHTSIELKRGSPDSANYHNDTDPITQGRYSQTMSRSGRQIRRESEISNSVVKFQSDDDCYCEPSLEEDGNDFTRAIGNYVSEMKSKVCKSLTSIFSFGDNKCKCAGCAKSNGNKSYNCMRSKKSRSKKSLGSSKSDVSRKSKYHDNCFIETPRKNYCANDTPRDKSKNSTKTKKDKGDKKKLKINSKKELGSSKNISKNKNKKNKSNHNLKEQTSCKSNCACGPKDFQKPKKSSCACEKKSIPISPKKGKCVCTKAKLSDKIVHKSINEESKIENRNCSCGPFQKSLNDNILQHQMSQIERGSRLSDFFRGFGSATTKATQSDRRKSKTKDTMVDSHFIRDQKNDTKNNTSPINKSSPNANMNSSNMNSANTNLANMNSANINSANMNSENTNSVNINSANMNSANTNFANMNSVNMNSENMKSAYMSSENMNSANMSPTYMNPAKKNSSNVNTANMNSTNMNFANRNSLNMNTANMNTGNMNSANMNFANMNSANINSASINPVNINSINRDLNNELNVHKNNNILIGNLNIDSNNYKTNLMIDSNNPTFKVNIDTSDSKPNIDVNLDGLHIEGGMTKNSDDEPNLYKTISTFALSILTKSKDGFLGKFKSMTQMVASRLNMAENECTPNECLRQIDVSKCVTLRTSANQKGKSPVSDDQCACCPSQAVENVQDTRELEVNAFQLLQKYVQCKMKKMLCACCPHSSAAYDEKLTFAKMLEKVQGVISTDIQRLACHCQQRNEQEFNETMTFSLLEEYIRSKIDEIMCSCSCMGDATNMDLCATTLANIKEIIDTDLAELSCCCKTADKECTCIEQTELVFKMNRLLNPPMKKVKREESCTNADQKTQSTVMSCRDTENKKSSIEIKLTIKTSEDEMPKQIAIPINENDNEKRCKCSKKKITSQDTTEFSGDTKYQLEKESSTVRFTDNNSSMDNSSKQNLISSVHESRDSSSTPIKMGPDNHENYAPCECQRIPLCQVKMLVKDIEGKLQTDTCICKTLTPSVCPVHRKVECCKPPIDSSIPENNADDQARSKTCSTCSIKRPDKERGCGN